jgi:predicted ATP-dependent protease
MRVLTEIAATRAPPDDRSYVHNFAQPDQPRLLTLPSGRAVVLRRAMDRFIELMRMVLPAFFEDEIVEARRRAVSDRYERREAELFARFSKEAEAKGFGLVKVQAGQVSRPEVVPVHDGEAVPFDRLRQLVSEGKLEERVLEEKEAVYGQLRARLAELVREGRVMAREMNAELGGMVREEASHMLAGPLGDIEEELGDEAVGRFLRHVREDVIDLLCAPFEGGGEAPNLEEHLNLYRVNVVADRSGADGAPVVVENYPTVANLFGGITVGVGADGGSPHPPTAQDIRCGSILAADGGFLVLRARDVIGEAGAWDSLRRTLSTSLVEFPRPTQPSPSGPSLLTLKPEPIPILVQVVLVGDPALFDVLWNADADFRTSFRVKAEFDPVMERTEECLGQFCLILDALCKENGLRPLVPDGAARVLEWSARQAGGRGKVLARFGEMEDLLREADYEAGASGSDILSGACVERALAKRRTRNGRIEERALELMRENVIRIEVEGREVGQVNGLSVLDLGYHRFGKPTRITATSSVGRAGIISIEREARLSGLVYDKGVLIITGWLRRRYAQDRPLTLTGSLCFEQSYAGVDGDSASIAEIIALLSELSGLPVDQAIAVTGSVDQHGNLQPVGGLNEKVEGFYDLCHSRGLTGRQGVMFPEANLVELNLRQDVAEAVESGGFSLYGLETLPDALEVAMDATMKEIDRRVIEKLEAYGAVLSESSADLPPSPPMPAPPTPALRTPDRPASP